MTWIIGVNCSAKRDTSARYTCPEDQERDNRERFEGHLSGKRQAKPSEESPELYASRTPMPTPWIGHGPVGPARVEVSFTDGRLPCRTRPHDRRSPPQRQRSAASRRAAPGDVRGHHLSRCIATPDPQAGGRVPSLPGPTATRSAPRISHTGAQSA